MKIIKNIAIVFLMVLAGIMLLVGISFLINGSLEAFPTEEQMEKVQLCGCLFTVVGLVIESISAILLYKNNKKN